MLQLGYLVFGLVGTGTMLLPVILALSTGTWSWLLALIPAFLISRLFYTLSGYCRAKQIENATGLDIHTQAKFSRRGE